MKKDNEKKLIFLFLGAFLIMIFIMIFAHKAEAALPQQSKLPFLVDSENFVNADGYTLQDLQNFYNARWGNSYPKDFTSQDVLIYEYTETISNVNYNFTTVWIPNASNYTYEITLNETYNSFDTDINQASIKFRGYSFVSFSTYRNRYNDPAFTLSASATTVTFFYNSNKEVTYISNPYYYLASSIDGANDYPVFAIPQPVFPTGHATPPDLTDEDLTVDDNILNPPIWETPTNPPTFDSSDIPRSTYNLIEWGIADPNGPFHILKNNLQSGFQWLVNVISGYGQAIINNIQKSIQNLYENFVSLFEPISQQLSGIYDKITEFADLFINPFDEEEFEDQIDNCQLITRYNELLENCEVIQQIFDETSEPDSFILYIDFENPFADSEHKIIASEINFNWLVPLRPVYRPFLTVFTLIECFVGGFRILGNIIGGKAK